MKPLQNLTVKAYRDPQSILSFTLNEWDVLIRQARSSNMLARLSVRFEDANLIEDLPEQIQFHLNSEKIAAEALARSIRWEVHCICEALAETDIPIILLKGAAYVCSEQPAQQGRLFEDVDVMVPKNELDTVERKFMVHGWVTTHTDAYDQRYYRQWMHELPPMRHVKRGSSLDVHHTILPETARLHPNPEKLVTAAKIIDDKKRLKVLAEPDMILHSATHLFFDGELNNGLRDLTDIDLLLREFSQDPNFWQTLIQRSLEMDLKRPLYFALRYSKSLLNTPAPDDIIQQSKSGSPNPLMEPVMDWLFYHGLEPDHPSCRRLFSGIARWMLYIRSHYLRMPLHLLLPHLIRKAIKKDSENS